MFYPKSISTMNTRQLLKIFGLIGVLSVGLSSCFKDEYDLSKIKIESDVSTGIALKLAYGELSIDQFLPDSADGAFHFYIDENDLIHLAYRDTLDTITIEDIYDDVLEQDTTITFVAGDAADIPVTDFNNGLTVTSERSIVYDYKGTNSSQEIDSFLVRKGELSLNISSQYPYNGLFTLSYPSILKPPYRPQDSLTIVINNQGNLLHDTAVDLSQCKIILYDAQADQGNRLPVNYRWEINKAGQNISDGLEISNTTIARLLEYDWVYGYFGRDTFNFEVDTIDIGADELDFDGKVYFDNPVVKLITVNSIGAPVRFTLDENTKALYDDDREEPFVIASSQNPKNIGYPAFSEMGQSKKDSLVLDKTTSNLRDLLYDLPKSLIIGGMAVGNPDDNPGIYNFSLQNSEALLIADVDIPLNLELTGFSLKDTMESDLGSTLENLDFLDVAKLQIVINNGLPLSINAQVYFYGELSDGSINTAVIVDSLFYSETGLLLAGGQLNDQGEVVTSVSSGLVEVEITGERLEKLKTVKHMVFRVGINTVNPGTLPNHNTVKILSKNKVDMHFGVKAKGTFSLSEEGNN